MAFDDEQAVGPELATATAALWGPGRGDDGGALGAKHRLTGATKRLVELVALLDPSETPAEGLGALADAVASLAERMAPLPSLRARGGLASAGGPEGALTERSGISGRSNPLAPPLTIEFDGEHTRGAAHYTAAYEGPPGSVHGGFVAAAFDDLLGVAQVASGRAGYTGTLTVRFRRTTPLERTITYEGGVKAIHGRKITCWGRSTCDGEVLAEAEGLFVAPRDADFVMRS